MMNLESRKSGKELGQRGLTERIIGAAIRVHKDLGPGFLEAIYEESLAVEFALSGITFVRQHAVPLYYKGHRVGEHRLDFFVEGAVVVELKAIESLQDIHFAVGRSYLKAMNVADGLLLNFATCPLTIKRVARERADSVGRVELAPV